LFCRRIFTGGWPNLRGSDLRPSSTSSFVRWGQRRHLDGQFSAVNRENIALEKKFMGAPVAVVT